MESLDRARRDYAEKIRATAGLRSETLVRAFASVPREDFLGPGPWKVLRPPDARSYEATPDADPRNLAPWPSATAVCADGCEFDVEPFDVIFVNAGATEVLARWLDSLRGGGSLLIPLTVDVPMPNVGVGQMLLVVRRGDAYAARFVSPVGIFHCAGARTAEGNHRLSRAYQRGDQAEVRSLRRDDHPSVRSAGSMPSGAACLGWRSKTDCQICLLSDDGGPATESGSDYLAV